MATAAFRSTSRRTSIGRAADSISNSNSNSSSARSHHHRRSRSVSRFSHRLPAEEATAEDDRRGKFVNTVRGSGFPEISLDDLAIEMFSMTSSLSDVSSHANNDCDGATSHRRGRSVVIGEDKSVSNRRGRSVSRRGSRVSELRSSSKNSSNSFDKQLNRNKNDVSRERIGGFDNGSVRRRRSLSVVPRNFSLGLDSELSFQKNEHFQKNRSRADFTHQKPTSSNQQRGLRRCNSQKDLLRSYDGYTSFSSTLTDDEGNDGRYIGLETEKKIRETSAIDKGPHISSRDRNNLYKAEPNQCTHPSKDNRLEMLKDDTKLPGLAIIDGRRSAESDALKAVSTIRKNYKTKLEESEKRKQELLAAIMLEEERGEELKKIVGDWLPTAKETSPSKRPMRGRKRSTDRTRVPKKLLEDADKIIEDFISSVEETDISSSFDDDRSDTSSIVRGTLKPMMYYGDIEPFKSPLRSDLHPMEMDGVVLPWLKWETGDDGTPLTGKNTKQHPATPKTVLQNALEETNSRTEEEQSINSKSSRGSWSPGIANSMCMDMGETSRTGEIECCKNQLLLRVPRRSRVDIDDYLKPPSDDNILSEIFKKRDIIHSGGLLICNGGSFGKFLV